MKTMLFNPYTGKPRDPRDIASDPSGILMIDPDEPLIAAAAAALSSDTQTKKMNAQAMLIKAQEERLAACHALLEQAREARATLESERQANAILTAEVEALKEQQASATPAGGGQNPTINYEPLHAFALDNRVSYNELCAAVRKAIAPAASPAPAREGLRERLNEIRDAAWEAGSNGDFATVANRLIDNLLAASPVPMSDTGTQELEDAKALADSEGTRAVQYLRRARKAEASVQEAENIIAAMVRDTKDYGKPELIAQGLAEDFMRKRALAPPPPQSASGEALHPRTAGLVDRFADSLKAKLAAAEKKYGYSDKWANDDWQQECAAKLLEHVAKGDPRDVAAYCAFMWHHDWSTTPTQASWQVSHGAKCPARDGYPCCCEVTQSAPQEAAEPVTAGERVKQLIRSHAGRVYIAGPMTGLPEFNFPAFNAKAEELRAQGWHVENPAEHGHVDGAVWSDYLRYDLTRIATCEAIYLLPGWSASKGATLEVQVARALGMQIIGESIALSAPQEAGEADWFAEPIADTGHPEADRIINRLMSSDPEFDDCEAAARLIRWMAKSKPTNSPRCSYCHAATSKSLYPSKEESKP